MDWNLEDYGFDEEGLKGRILGSFEDNGIAPIEDVLKINYGRKGVVEVSYVADSVDVKFDINFELEEGWKFEGNQINLWLYCGGEELGTKVDRAMQSLANKLKLGRVLVSGLDDEDEKFWLEKRSYESAGSGTMGIKLIDF